MDGGRHRWQRGGQTPSRQCRRARPLRGGSGERRGGKGILERSGRVLHRALRERDSIRAGRAPNPDRPRRRVCPGGRGRWRCTSSSRPVSGLAGIRHARRLRPPRIAGGQSRLQTGTGRVPDPRPTGGIEPDREARQADVSEDIIQQLEGIRAALDRINREDEETSGPRP